MGGPQQPSGVPSAQQVNYQAAQVASRLRADITAGNRLYAWAARRGGAAGLVAAGWDPGDAAAFVANASALRTLAQIFNGQASLPDRHDFGADLADLADLAGPI